MPRAHAGPTSKGAGGRTIAREGAELARRAGLDAKPLVERGNGVAGVAATIARVASDRGTRVLVVGRRGMSKLRSVVLGSVWSAIVERPSCPVLLPPEEN